MLQWNGSRTTNSLAASSTFYFAAGNTTTLQDASATSHYQTMRAAGVWSNLYCRIPSNNRGTSTLKSQVNLANGNQSISISGTGEFEDTSNSDTITAGDEISEQLITGAGGSSFVITLITSLYAATTDDIMRVAAVDGVATTINGATRFEPLVGFIGGDTTITQTEANVQYSSRASLTATHFFVNVRANAKGGNSFVRFRKNTSNGNLVVTVGSTVTGILEDTSNSDSVSSGDEINFSIDYYADANNLRLWSIGLDLETTSKTAPQLSAAGIAGALTVAASATANFAPGAINGSTTESDYRGEANVAQTLTYLSAFVISNGITANTTLRVRKNGGNGNQLITAGSGATGYMEDASNSDVFALGDELTYQIVGGGSGTSIVLNNIATLQDTAVGGQPAVRRIARSVYGLEGVTVH